MPIPVHQLNLRMPPELGRIIGKTLEKDRELRYQSAADLQTDLKRLIGRVDKASSEAPLASFSKWRFERLTAR